jgi:hypothetical protein
MTTIIPASGDCSLLTYLGDDYPPNLKEWLEFKRSQDERRAARPKAKQTVAAAA